MTCYHPLQAWQSDLLNNKGKRDVIFKKAVGFTEIQLPCGQCIGCRLERSRIWALRCVHEASLYSKNCFITLTFNNESLDSRNNKYSLDKSDFQLFMKRLRKRFHGVDSVVSESNPDGKIFPIRFFHCGEYGELYGRPHYHACLFNFDFPDKVFLKRKNDNDYYTSESLSELWPYGFSVIGDVTFDSAAYVARYIMKKVTGDDADEHYNLLDVSTGEVFTRIPEYTTMSRMPGIGKRWIQEYLTSVYPRDAVRINGQSVKPPRYYDSFLESEFPDDFSEIKSRRKENARVNSYDNGLLRLAQKEYCKKQQISLLKRELE